MLRTTLVTTLLLGLGATPALARDVKVVHEPAKFHSMRVLGSLDVVMLERGPKALVLSGPQEAVKRVQVEVKDGVLVLRETQTPGARFRLRDLFERRPARVLCELTTVPLEHIELSGACNLDAAGLKGDRLTLEVAGASRAKLSGKLPQFRLDLSGAGAVNAARLVSQAAEIEVDGACEVTVNAVKTLKIRASGASDITYLGHPTVEQDVSGVCTIRNK